ncbi:hypothetical protein K525DRAFT_214814 [Schizophyllum commune Loenen D]|nr:hypothetical protein K525DRAFT_214814 [Schizophyllum commune Loenen D]
MPADPGDPRDYENEEERWRIRAIHTLRCELRTKVYAACDWDRPRNYVGDDPMDPVIDYEALKGKLSCVFNLRYAGQFGENLDWPWEARAPFNWAPHDAVHAQIAAGDEVLQRFLAAGGDPVPQPTRCYVEIDE